MKIGLSYSRCVRDIVEGKVDIRDVLVIVARTDFDPHNDEQWSGIWRGYSGGSFLNMSMEWGEYGDEDEQRFRDVSCALWDGGKLHQPRQFGAHPRRLPYYWLETIVADNELENSPTVKDAWDKFQMVSGLKGTPLKVHNE
jgi:hypothetical protein